MIKSGNHAWARLSRRALLGSIAAVPAAALLAQKRVLGTAFSRARPGTAAWPSTSEWAALARELGGRLIRGDRPSRQPSSELLANPFFVGDQVGLTESSGWFGAWRSSPSAYAVHASSAADVAAAVRFAARHRLRLVVKGGGHSYLGGSNAPDSLLLWTRAMDGIEIHDNFVPNGCKSAPVPAVSLGSGCIWGRVYRAVCVEKGRYVQGGGCTTVGVAGLVQGGGFGSFSKAFGLAAASLLEAEIVTADGEIRTVNACRDPDLFWALKGGGGGTFGIVTRMTLKTHELPSTFGGIDLAIEAHDERAFERLLAEFLAFARVALVNPHWGEQARAHNNRLQISMSFQGLTGEQVQAAWRPLIEKVEANSTDWKIASPLRVLAGPARHYWDADFLSRVIPEAIIRDSRPGARPGDFWWAGDGDQVGAFWEGFTSLWLPNALLSGGGVKRLARAWVSASSHWPVGLHFNKGLAGASPETIAASRDTAMNPQVLDSFALAIIGAAQPAAYPGWGEPDPLKAKTASAAVQSAEALMRSIVPGAGSYMSECDYFLKDWKRASWGDHWQRLERIKERYDPDGLFVVHHGVGSDRWSADGFRRV